MRKLLSIGGGGVLVILSFLTTTVSAKSLPSSSAVFLPTSDLSEQLAADKNFQDFAFLIHELSRKIQVTKSGKLFVGYLEKRNSQEETQTLLKNLGYYSKTEFNEYWKKLYLLKSGFHTKFPELTSQENVKGILENAFQKVSTNQNFAQTTKVPTSLCWYTLAAMLSSCPLFICNSNFHQNEPDFNWYDCMVACEAMAITGSFLCFLFAD